METLLNNVVGQLTPWAAILVIGAGWLIRRQFNKLDDIEEAAKIERDAWIKALQDVTDAFSKNSEKTSRVLDEIANGLKEHNDKLDKHDRDFNNYATKSATEHTTILGRIND